MTIKETIVSKLTIEFSPQSLEVIDESHLHKGHRGNPGGGETHFHLIIKAETLKGLPLVQVHRKIYKCLDEELKNGVHALKISLN
jgi:BolA protein